MVDAVGSIAKIVGVALKIKEAATTARQNKKDCRHIKGRVDVLNKTLSHHENNTDLMEDPAVMAALEALHGILAEALEVITECQEKRSIICVYCTAGNLSRQLSKVEQRISYLSSDAMLTIMSHQLLTKHATTDSMCTSWSRDPGETLYTGWSLEPELQPLSPPQKDISLHSSPAASAAAEITGEPHSLVQIVAEVASNIKEAVETVLQNRDECLKIGELVNKVSTLLSQASQLQGNKMVDEPAMRGTMENLLATFSRAHTLVIACQRRGLTIVGLSRQLHEVMDQMASNITDMTAVVLT